MIDRAAWLEAFDCRDCGTNTHEIMEYYMVHSVLWCRYGVDPGMLCIGCLEARMGRQLTAADFTACPLNQELGSKSERLLSRLLSVPQPTSST